MKKNKASINIISSFNDTNFIGLLKNSQDFDWKVNQVDYNQVFQTLTDPQKKIWKEKANITLIWTTPELISSEFRKLQDKNSVNTNIIEKEVSYFCSCLKSIKKFSEIIVVPNWILKQPIDSNLTQSYKKDFGIEYNLSFMNHYLATSLNKEKDFYILNSTKWLNYCGIENTYSPKLWYLSKTPFSNNFFKEAVSDISNFPKWLICKTTRWLTYSHF